MTARPAFLTATPGQRDATRLSFDSVPQDDRPRPRDPLSDVLRAVDLRGDVYARTYASGAWGVAFPPGHARFHFVERGVAWAQVDGLRGATRLVAGDLLVVPRGAAHSLADRAGRTKVPLLDLLKRQGRDGEVVLRLGSGAAETVLTCGRFVIEAPGPATLFEALPPLIRVPRETDRAGLGAVLRVFTGEAHSGALGSGVVSARVVEILLVRAIRAWLAANPQATGWIGAMRDPVVGAALARMHDEPSRDWTVDELAASAGLSRSPFAARFTELAGEPPLRYLTRLRMLLAAEMLRRGASVGDAAARSGYGSEAAFSRAFKRVVGRTAATVRRGTIDS